MSLITFFILTENEKKYSFTFYVLSYAGTPLNFVKSLSKVNDSQMFNKKTCFFSFILSRNTVFLFSEDYV